MSSVKWLDETCNVCNNRLNSWDVRLSKTLAYKIPVCEKCIAEEYDMDAEMVAACEEDEHRVDNIEG